MGVMGALLLAPKSGRELREELADEGRKLRAIPDCEILQ
jgi:gas vesicle protein